MSREYIRQLAEQALAKRTLCTTSKVSKLCDESSEIDIEFEDPGVTYWATFGEFTARGKRTLHSVRWTAGDISGTIVFKTT